MSILTVHISRGKLAEPFNKYQGKIYPLQCSCLENPRDWGAWWAAVYGVAQSRTRLKRFSSSSSSSMLNGTPLQCSCLENPRDGGAWWAAVYGVAQSRIRLKRLSSSSSSSSALLSNTQLYSVCVYTIF